MRAANTEIYNVRLSVDGALLTIGIYGGEIVYVGERQGCAHAIDGRGLVAIPGLIDGHVHFRHFGSTDFAKEDWMHGTRAAIAGGVTTVLDMGNHPGDDAVTTAEAFARKLKIINQYGCNISFRLWFMATPDGIDEFRELLQVPLLASQLAGIKVCMEETTGGIIVEKYRDVVTWCQVAAETNTLIAAHVGNQAMIQKNRQRFVRPSIADHCAIRDTDVEVSGGLDFLRALLETGARGEIKHVSTPELVEQVQKTRYHANTDVSLEICPHHWLLSDRQLQREDAAYFKMNPPLRTPEQVVRMQGYLADGTINTIATDHAPHTRQEKEAREYDQVPSGIPGVQEMMPLALRLVQEDKLTLEQVVDVGARQPARLYGLMHKGDLVAGKDADVVLLNPEQVEILCEDEVQSKCCWSAYAGQPLYGRPRLVMARGQIVLNRL